jgi:hypothetical protein
MRRTMETSEVFEELGTERSRTVRGADAVFDRAEAAALTRRPERPRARWSIAAAAAVVAVLGAAAYLLYADRDDPDVVAAGVEESQPASAGNPGDPAVVLGVPSPPDGFELVSAVDTGVPSVWTGPTGDLTVFQRLGENGRVAEQVIAIGVSDPSERTALDTVSAEPEASSAEVVAGVEVSFASVASGLQTVSTYGEFDTARWIGADGSSVIVATRGLGGDEVRTVVSALVAGVPPADLSSRVAVAGQMKAVPADPVRVPGLPQFASARLSYVSADGSRLLVGTERGPWPSAADLLWWSAGSQLTTDGDLVLAGGLTYRDVPGGSATALGGPGVPGQSVSSAVDAVVPMTQADWVSAVGESDESVATTSEAPQGN